MKQSTLTYCANRAAVLRSKIRFAKGVVNAQAPAIIEDAIQLAEEIAARLRDQLPTPPPKPTPPAGTWARESQQPAPPPPKDTRDGRVPTNS